MRPDLDCFFNPRSIAVIGASAKPEKLGHQTFKSIVKAGFKGKLYPVNLRGEDVLGYKGYRSVKEIPEDVDLAVICIPAKFVPEVVKECGEKGVKGVIVISGGFKEVGGEGKLLEERLVEYARAYGVRIVGPNCVGVYCPKTGVDTLFLPAEKSGKPPHGSISIISQSGALGTVFLDWAEMYSIGIAKFVSYGNRADVDESELLLYLRDDPDTKVIAAYLESIADGKRFVEALKETTPVKPVVVIKAGRTEAGAKAASSHTGAIASSDVVVSAVLKQYGAVRAYDTSEFFEYSIALASGRLLKGNRIAVVTNGGGAGVMAVDKLTDKVLGAGLRLAGFASETLEELRSYYPPYVQVGNPVDLTGDSTADWYEHALKTVVKDPNVDGLLAITLFQAPKMDDTVIDVVEEVYRSTDKPMLVVVMGGRSSVDKVREYNRRQIPVYLEAERAAKAMKVLKERYEFLKRVKSGVPVGGES